jgi:phosphotriesterase-related protein
MGANLNHLVISHVDKNKDLTYHHDLMQMGVSVEYDSAFRWKKDEENWTYTLLEQLLPLYPKQITVGMDAARNTYWKSYQGNPGLDYLLTTFVQGLKNRNLETYFTKIFIENPARIFCFEH